MRGAPSPSKATHAHFEAAVGCTAGEATRQDSSDLASRGRMSSPHRASAWSAIGSASPSAEASRAACEAQEPSGAGVPTPRVSWASGRALRARLQLRREWGLERHGSTSLQAACTHVHGERMTASGAGAPTRLASSVRETGRLAPRQLGSGLRHGSRYPQAVATCVVVRQMSRLGAGARMTRASWGLAQRIPVSRRRASSGPRSAFVDSPPGTTTRVEWPMTAVRGVGVATRMGSLDGVARVAPTLPHERRMVLSIGKRSARAGKRAESGRTARCGVGGRARRRSKTV